MLKRVPRTDLPPLIFVYLDNELPKYAVDSLRIARKNYSGEIVLITNTDTRFSLPGVEVVDSRGWYQTNRFSSFKDQSPLDQTFRDGFWFTAVERFFVLDQFVKLNDINRFFHAELDVLVLEIDDLAASLDCIGKGFFCPLEANQRAIASLTYVNEPAVLSELIDFFFSNSNRGTEMSLIGLFVEQSSQAFELPSSPFGLVHQQDAQIFERTDVGLVDAAVLGQWVLGKDPKNTHLNTTNHYTNPYAEKFEERPRLKSYRRGRGILIRNQGGDWVRVRTLHVHAKTFRRLRVPGVLAFYVAISNAPFDTVVTVRPSSWIQPIINFLLSETTVSLSRRLGRSISRGIGKGLLHVLQYSSRPLSSRQVRAVQQLIGKVELRKSINLPLRTLALPMNPANHRVRRDSPTPLTSLDDDYDMSKEVIDWCFRNPNGLAMFSTVWATNFRTLGFATKKKTGVFLGAEKETKRTQLAANYWGLSENTIFPAISSHMQIIRADWMLQMFSFDRRLASEWLGRMSDYMSRNPQSGCSALHNYGVWVIANKKKELVPVAQTVST